MLKMTLWFDRFDSLEDQLSQLNSAIKYSKKEKAAFSIVGINYSKKIFQTIEKNSDIITHVSYENLKDNILINTTEGSKKINYVSNLNFVQTIDGLKYRFGDFEVLDC